MPDHLAGDPHEYVKAIGSGQERARRWVVRTRPDLARDDWEDRARTALLGDAGQEKGVEFAQTVHRGERLVDIGSCWPDRKRLDPDAVQYFGREQANTRLVLG